MSPAAVATTTSTGRPHVLVPAPRTVVVAIADGEGRGRVRDTLAALRWHVREAAGGAAALELLEALRPEALLVGEWLPDLTLDDFVRCALALSSETDLLRMDGVVLNPHSRSARRHELLATVEQWGTSRGPTPLQSDAQLAEGLHLRAAESPVRSELALRDAEVCADLEPARNDGTDVIRRGFLPEMVGTSPGMAELAQLVRLVAPRSTTVLIEGETGSGKELVAKALHRLSARANKPFVTLNCAAIPEALLEAELFGHARGAFTGAVKSRTGRIEAADGGTLFLDEIGEMPLALQAKMLRFLECGELQRVGDNEPTYVDVRVIAATHQPLEQRAEEGQFRLDLYHRLAVFPVDVPNLRSRMSDLPVLAEFFLGHLAVGAAPKHLTQAATELLCAHPWPGNVRELMHVLERAVILCGADAEIGAEHIRIRRRDRSPA